MPCPLLGDLPDPGIKPASPMAPALLVDSLPLSHQGSPTGVSSHPLLQGILPTQGLNLGLLHCRRILYCLKHQGSCPERGIGGCKGPLLWTGDEKMRVGNSSLSEEVTQPVHFPSCSSRDQSPAGRAGTSHIRTVRLQRHKAARRKGGSPGIHRCCQAAPQERSRSSPGSFILRGSREGDPADPRDLLGPLRGGTRDFPELEGLLEFLVRVA